MASSTPRPAQPLLSAVVPFLNEADNLPRLIGALERVLSPLGLPWELVLVDDGSRDGSLAVAKAELQRRPQLNATLISLSRNFGKEAALTAGLEAAQGDVVVPLDADLQDPPELIGPMLEQGCDATHAPCAFVPVLNAVHRLFAVFVVAEAGVDARSGIARLASVPVSNEPNNR